MKPEDIIPLLLITALLLIITFRIPLISFFKRFNNNVETKAEHSSVLNFISRNIKYVSLVLFIITIYFAFENSSKAGPWSLAFAISLLVTVIYYAATNYKELEEPEDENTQKNTSRMLAQNSRQPVMAYYGNELNFSSSELKEVLLKRFPYYSSLPAENQEIFISRLQKFINAKVFKIHGNTGYKEMPILISASAIQLTFGLSSYMLPHFEYIHVYPEEFVRVNHSITFLEGNVTGKRINLSWKHFLDGYNIPDDGQNVGLHEMSHALYYQIFEVDEYTHRPFKTLYNDFLESGKRVYSYERTNDGGIYSDYAVRNIQEFWAESIELFFEKPAELKAEYPGLYEALVNLLNQNPAIG